MRNNIEKSLSSLIIFIPLFIILGPAIPDIIISLSAIYALSIIVIDKKYNELNNNLLISLFVFWISINISSLFSENFIMSMASSFLYLRFIFFLVFVKLFFSLDVLRKLNPFLILTLCLFFVIIDTYIQFFFREDLFGNKLDNNFAVRLTGPFLHGEQIVGSYLSKFGYICLGYLLSFQIKNKIKSEISFSLFFILIYLIIYLSGERMAFILFNFGIMLFLMLEKSYLIKIFRLLIISLPILIFISLYSQSHVLKRAISTFNILGFNFLNENIENKNFLDSHYGAHYLTSLKIFQNHILTGVGSKMFREECAKDEYKNIKSDMSEHRCATHSHNIYLQLLSESGLFGLTTFLIFVIILIKNVFMYMKQEKTHVSKSIFISIILFFWPLQSNGGLFNNRYSAMLFFLVSLFFLMQKIKED